MGVRSTMNAECYCPKKLLVTFFGSDTEVVEWVPNYWVTFSTLTPSVDEGSMAFIALIAVVAVLIFQQIPYLCRAMHKKTVDLTQHQTQLNSVYGIDI